jgi:uncharacterized protein (DUF779 family)
MRYVVGDRVVNTKTGQQGTVIIANEQYREERLEEIVIEWATGKCTVFARSGPSEKKPLSIKDVEPMRRADA